MGGGGGMSKSIVTPWIILSVESRGEGGDEQEYVYS